MARRPVRSGHYEEAPGPHGFGRATRRSSSQQHCESSDGVAGLAVVPQLGVAEPGQLPNRRLHGWARLAYRGDARAGLSLRIAKTHDDAWI
jgi:hypothetical protein